MQEVDNAAQCHTGILRGFRQQAHEAQGLQVHSLADQESKMLAAGSGHAVFEKAVAGGVRNQIARTRLLERVFEIFYKRK